MIDVIYIPNNMFIASIYTQEEFDGLFTGGPLRICSFGYTEISLFYKLTALYNTLRGNAELHATGAGAIDFNVLFNYYYKGHVGYIPPEIRTQSLTYCSQFFVKTDFLLISTE
jgi:hypothetical protein